MKIILEMSANIVQSFLEVWFISNFCGYKYSGARKHIGFAAVWLMSVAVISFLNCIVPYDGILSAISIFVWIIYGELFLKKDSYTHIFVSVFALLIIFTSNGILMFVTSCVVDMSFLEMIQTSSGVRVFTLTAGRILEFLIYSGVLYISKDYKLNRGEWIMITIVSFLTWSAVTVFTSAALKYRDLGGQMLGASLIMGAINVMIYYIIIKIHRDTELESENRLLKMQYESIESTQENLRALYDSQRALKHDLEKHFLALKVMAQRGSNSDIVSYIDKVSDCELTPAYEYVLTDNEIFNAVINTRLAICKAKRIAVSFNIDNNAVSLIDPEDIVVLFGNLMDNAAEAAEKTDKRYIQLDVRNKNEYISVIIINSFSGEFDEDMNTTKKDKNKHGYGMKNVQKIVEKYDGMISCFAEDDMFCCDILLNNHRK